jgi:hypothetical protein
MCWLKELQSQPLAAISLILLHVSHKQASIIDKQTRQASAKLTSKRTFYKISQFKIDHISELCNIEDWIFYFIL